MHEGGALGPIENYSSQLNMIFEKRGVVLAFLYGSQATGRAGILSDVDLAVLFPCGIEAQDRFQRVLALMSDLSGVFGRDDVNVLDLDEGAPLLNNNVRLHGCVIYCADDTARVAFMIRALQQYEDTEPMRREQNFYLREKINRGLFGKPIPLAHTR